MKNAIVCLIVFAGLLFSCTETQREITINDFDRLITSDSIASIEVINDEKVVITKKYSKSDDQKLVLPITSAESMTDMLNTRYPDNKIMGIMYTRQTSSVSHGFTFIPLLVIVCFFGFFLIAVIDILKSRFVSDIEKLIWVLVVIFVPLLGPILYLVIGRKQKLKFEN